MKRMLIAVLLLSCATVRKTNPRRGWGSCHTDGSVITCHDHEMARLECYVPSDEACGALAIVYTGGERVFLYEPAGFDPAHPEFTGGGAVHPEIASDAGLIWFRDGDVRGDLWHVYDPQSGAMQERDAMAVEILRERAGSVPLWTRGEK